MHILWDPYGSIWYTCQFLNDIVIEFPESHNAIYYTYSHSKFPKKDSWQMDCILSLRGEKWPKWHAIYSMYTTHTLIVTLRNAKVYVYAAGIHFKNCILGNFRALSVQYNPFVSYVFFILLVCSHVIIVNRTVLKFP